MNSLTVGFDQEEALKAAPDKGKFLLKRVFKESLYADIGENIDSNFEL